MDKKQYDAMHLIMAKGRKFLEEIFGLMKENGLTDKGYEFTLRIDETHDIKKQLECDYLLSAELEKDSRYVGGEEWRKTAAHQWNKDGKGWVIMYDPHGKTEILPEDDNLSDKPSGEPESDSPATGETAEPAAESGYRVLWFSAADDDPPMVCRSDLREDGQE